MDVQPYNAMAASKTSKDKIIMVAAVGRPTKAKGNRGTKKRGSYRPWSRLIRTASMMTPAYRGDGEELDGLVGLDEGHRHTLHLKRHTMKNGATRREPTGEADDKTNGNINRR